MMIYNLLKEIEASAQSGNYHVALFTALTIPDIGGALDSDSGRATGTRYAGWFDKYVAPKYFERGHQLITGSDCYQFRCAMLHEGKPQSAKSRYSKTIFMCTQENVAYRGVLILDRGHTLCIDAQRFCENMAQAGYDWLEQVEDTDRFKNNAAEMLTLFTLSFNPEG